MDATASGAQGIAGRVSVSDRPARGRTMLPTVFARTPLGPRVPVERSAKVGADGEVVLAWRLDLAPSFGRCIRPNRVFGCIVNPRATGAKELGTPGRARISRNPLRGESRVDPVASWSTRALLCATAGAIGTRLSLRPSLSKEGEVDANLGRSAPREGARASIDVIA